MSAFAIGILLILAAALAAFSLLLSGQPGYGRAAIALGLSALAAITMAFLIGMT